MEKKVIQIRQYHSPCGDLVLGSFEGKLCLCDWKSEKHRKRADERLQKAFGAVFEESESEIVRRAAGELDEFFAGRRKEFDIPLVLTGTDFQKKVWNFLLTVPYGTTLSYGEMARRLGMPKAVRAVANANGANALSIFVPCHRIVGSDHSLTGYGGGLAAKKLLLEIEGSPRVPEKWQSGHSEG